MRDLMLRFTGRTQVETGRANNEDWVHEQSVLTSAGVVLVKLRICAGLKSQVPESWSAAILAFNERIDGICHHGRAPDGKGGTARGWHRHCWNANKRSCKEFRNEIPDFDPGSTFESFISNCCGHLGVILEEEVDYNAKLSDR